MKDYLCEKHGHYQGEPVAVMGLTFESECPLCLAEEDAKADEFRRREAEELARLDLERSRKSMNLEPLYYEVTLDSFVAETQEQKSNLAKTRDLIEGKIKKLVMTGKNGTGKTHLACAALKTLGGKIMTMYEISTRIRSSYTAKSTETELEIVDALARLPLFVIDELGRTKGGDAEQNWLSYILDKRHVRGLPTILITNKHVKKDCPEKDRDGKPAGCHDCLENYLTEDVMSRLSEGGVMARFTGDDWRKRRA